jgi:hypothetical protein
MAFYSFCGNLNQNLFTFTDLEAHDFFFTKTVIVEQISQNANIYLRVEQFRFNEISATDSWQILTVAANNERL